MWSHWSVDVTVYSGLAAVVLFPVLAPLLRKLHLPALPAAHGGPDRWQSDSVAALIALQAELESRQKPAATKLCRELIWEILGGDTP
jgi:hypothetical protein